MASNKQTKVTTNYQWDGITTNIILAVTTEIKTITIK